MPDISNEELIELAKQQELEGGETTQVVQAVADRFGQISTELATAQALAVSETDREALKTSLGNAKALSDNAQAALTALLAPAA
jgi:hypothetical protein